jgi:hypothetical protein
LSILWAIWPFWKVLACLWHNASEALLALGACADHNEIMVCGFK